MVLTFSFISAPHLQGPLTSVPGSKPRVELQGKETAQASYPRRGPDEPCLYTAEHSVAQPAWPEPEAPTPPGADPPPCARIPPVAEWLQHDSLAPPLPELPSHPGHPSSYVEQPGNAVPHAQCPSTPPPPGLETS